MLWLHPNCALLSPYPLHLPILTLPLSQGMGPNFITSIHYFIEEETNGGLGGAIMNQKKQQMLSMQYANDT